MHKYFLSALSNMSALLYLAFYMRFVSLLLRCSYYYFVIHDLCIYELKGDFVFPSFFFGGGGLDWKTIIQKSKPWKSCISIIVKELMIKVYKGCSELGEPYLMLKKTLKIWKHFFPVNWPYPLSSIWVLFVPQTTISSNHFIFT